MKKFPIYNRGSSAAASMAPPATPRNARGDSEPAVACSKLSELGWLSIVASAVFALSIAGAGGCPNSSDSHEEVELDPRRNMTVQSRDEVLTVTLPADLHVHRHTAAIQGVSADGRFRVHVEHGPDDLLMRLVGHAKEVLGKRDWDVKLEKHYTHAVELRLKRGGVSGTEPEARTIWWVKANQRVLTCDGVAEEVSEARVGAPFRALCQGVQMTPPPPPEPDATGDGARSSDAPNDGDSVPGGQGPDVASPSP